MRTILCAAALAALSSCAMPAYNPPEVSRADIAAAQVRANALQLTRMERSPEAREDLLRRAEVRIRDAALTLCPEIADGDCSFSVRLDDSDLPNAFVDEQGRVRITTGLLPYLETEDEVAMVVAHEFAHRIADHAAEGRRNAAVGSALGAAVFGGLSVATGGGALLAIPALGIGVQAGRHVGGLSYSKAQEREADYIGSYLVATAGYDLGRAGRVMDNLAALEVQQPAAPGLGRSSFFATHPSSPERMARMARIAAEIAEKRAHDWPLRPVSAQAAAREMAAAGCGGLGTSGPECGANGDGTDPRI